MRLPSSNIILGGLIIARFEVEWTGLCLRSLICMGRAPRAAGVAGPKTDAVIHLGGSDFAYEHTYDVRRNLIINSPADPGLQ
jgi:hypothetical protein